MSLFGKDWIQFKYISFRNKMDDDQFMMNVVSQFNKNIRYQENVENVKFKMPIIIDLFLKK